MGKVFVVDVAKCSGCYSCQMACKDEFANADWLPYSKAQPDTGQFWTGLKEDVQGTIPKVKVTYTLQMCNHCRNPKCLQACRQEAIIKREDGFVIIDPVKCTGCRQCQEACPYDAIFFNEKENICQKCTGCAHLLDNGYKVPRCVENCPLDAITFGEEEDLSELLKGAVVRQAETGCLPRVYYRNVPGKFIAGTVYDPEEEEVLIGTKCIAVSGGKIVETVTDEFGDFWFKDLAVGNWDITITAKEHEEYHNFGIRTDESVNLGDIPMKYKPFDSKEGMVIEREIGDHEAGGGF